MFSDLNVFKTAFAMATHAGQRQALAAQNMANADTPGYAAKDLEPFTNAFSAATTDRGMRMSRSGHLGSNGDSFVRWEVMTTRDQQDPNANGVSIEEEMARSVDIKRQHDRALMVYQSSLNVLRSSLGRT